MPDDAHQAEQAMTKDDAMKRLRWWVAMGALYLIWGPETANTKRAGAKYGSVRGRDWPKKWEKRA